jgi:tetratricopeptide (TPR) repeat protein
LKDSFAHDKGIQAGRRGYNPTAVVEVAKSGQKESAVSQGGLVRTTLLLLGLALGAIPVRAERTDFSEAARQKFDEGQALQQKGRWQEAITAYEEAIQLGMRDYPRVHLYRGNSLLGLKEYDRAIAQFTDFLRDFTLEDSCRH